MKSLLTFVLLIVLGACSSDEGRSGHEKVVISAEMYDQTMTDGYSIIEADIVGDILNITLEASGCDGRTWGIRLIDSGAIAESYPVQRYAKILLENEELCEAIVTMKVTFDISSLRVEDQLYLNLVGWKDKLHYDF